MRETRAERHQEPFSKLASMGGGTSSWRVEKKKRNEMGKRRAAKKSEGKTGTKEKEL